MGNIIEHKISTSSWAVYNTDCVGFVFVYDFMCVYTSGEIITHLLL